MNLLVLMCFKFENEDTREQLKKKRKNVNCFSLLRLFGETQCKFCRHLSASLRTHEASDASVLFSHTSNNASQLLRGY